MVAPGIDVFCGSNSCAEKIDFIRGKVVSCKGPCKLSFHKRCSKISDVLYTSYLNDNNKSWFCKNCENKLKTSSANKNHTNARLQMEKNNSPSGSQSVQLQEIMKKLNTVIEQNVTLEQKLAALSDDLRTTVDKLSNKIDTLNTENVGMKQQLENMHFRMNNMEQQKLIMNIEISGIQEKKDENLRELILNLNNKVGCNLSNNNILSIYRKRNRNKNKNGSTHPIIAVLNDVKLKDDFIKKCRKINKLNTSILSKNDLEKRPLYVNQQLTKPSQYLLAKAKEKKNEQLIKYVWVGEGKILIRRTEGGPVVRIHNISQLNHVTSTE